MRLIGIAAVFWMAAAASAQDARLSALHKTLQTLVTTYSPPTVSFDESLGARPELTVAKHQLRDWIETQLSSTEDLEHANALSDRINNALKTIQGPKLVDRNLLGSLDEVRIGTEAGLLIVTTAVGIVCQYDESAYAYQFMEGRWKRIWESEQTDYSPKKYLLNTYRR
jgi:hypothetical protein